MHKGFTMIELLITISIMGVLITGVMLSTSSPTASAKSVNIINNMRILKEAAAMYYLDHSDETITQDALNGDSGVKTYLDNSGFLDGTIYSFVIADGHWYVKHDFSSDPDSASLPEKLKSRAKSAGLLQTTGGAEYSSGTTVYMKAR